MANLDSDALVFFGATGDLAYQQIFPAIQAMIRHRHFDLPIIGVALPPWTVDQLRARAGFAGIEIDVPGTLAALCTGRSSSAELESAGLLAALRPRNLEQLAPERLRLPGGRQVKVHYEAGKPPWIESRLQDFFGVRETPRIGGVPVVVHLLAPNHRPVQVTTDLAGFWERLYPQVRRELSRRYPKHRWPETP